MQNKQKYFLFYAFMFAAFIFVCVSYLLKQPSAESKSKPVTAAVNVYTNHKLGSLSFEPCSLSQGSETVSAFCTTLHVPEDYAKPGARSISLAISWVPAINEAEPDPIFMLAGGPGQAARESYPTVASAFSEVHKNRHIILIDQRGTGNSSPLKCENTEGESTKIDNENYSASAAANFAKKCAVNLTDIVDVSQFTTADAILDLDAARKAIGADKINLIGMSYGTRVAQQYAKMFPKNTRTVTLDGVVPMNVVLGQDHAKNLESSLNLQFARCSKDKSCLAKMGNPREQLNQLLTKLNISPMSVNYPDALTGEWKNGEFSKGHITMLTRMLAYSPQAASLLPLQFREANNGHYESLMALSEMVTHDVSNMIMHGMQLSVMCSEDADELVLDSSDKKSLLGNELVELYIAQCSVWPHKHRPANFRAPLTGKLPVLILSGEFDPVTPPRYGDDVAKHLPNSLHIIVKGAGHNVLRIGCIPKLFATFVETASAKQLNITCIEKLTYVPFFTGYYGSEP